MRRCSLCSSSPCLPASQPPVSLLTPICASLPIPQIPLESEQELKKRERVLTGLRNMVLDWIVKIARKKGYSEDVQVSQGCSNWSTLPWGRKGGVIRSPARTDPANTSLPFACRRREPRGGSFTQVVVTVSACTNPGLILIQSV